jgi:hypothetical protein
MNQIHAILYDLLKSIFNIISTSTPVSSMWSHFFGFPTKTLNVFSFPPYTCHVLHIFCGHAAVLVGWGTALQVGMSRVRFPMVSLDFFIYIILLSALWPWGGLSLSQKWVPGIFSEGKGGRCWQHYHLFVLIVLKSGSLNFLEPSVPV